MAGYELATAYINLVTSGDDLASSIGKSFAAGSRAAQTEGRKAGKSFATAFDSAKPIDIKDQAEKAAAKVEVASRKVEDARKKEEDAARKVVIEEAKLEEQRSSSTAKASAILQTEDRLARAKDAAALASEKVSAALDDEERAKASAIAANDQLEASQRDTAQAADDTASSYRTLGDRIRAALRGDFKGAFEKIPEEADDAAEQVEERFEQTGQESAQRFGAGFKRLLGPILAAISAGAVVKIGWEAGVGLQQSTKTLEGLYGSADMAKTMMQDLKRVASDSVLDLSGYSAAAESLAYAGVVGDDAVDVLDNVGKAITTAGGDTTSLDRAGDAILKGVNAGKFQLDTLQQLSDAGVPILSGLAEHFGVTMEELNKMASAGEVGLEDVIAVMKNGTGETFEQMIDASGTAASSLSNQWAMAKDRISVALGEAFQPLIEKIAPLIAPLAEKVAGAITSIVSSIQGVFGWFQRWQGLITPIAFGLLGIVTAIGLYSGAMGLAALATKAWSAALAVTPLGWIGLAVGALVGVLTWFFTKTETGSKLWAAIWSGIKVAAAAVVTWFQSYVVPVWNTVTSAIGSALSWVWSTVLKPVFAALVAVWRGVVAPALQWLWSSVIKPIFGFIGTLISVWWNYIVKPQFAALVAIWRNVVAPALQWLWGSIFKPIFGFIGTLISVWWNMVLKPAFNALVEIWRNVVAPVLRWLWGVFSSIFSLIGAMIRAWWNGIVKPLFTAVVGFVRDTLGPIFRWLWNSVIKPVWDGISDTISRVWNNKIKPVFTTLRDFIKDKVAPVFKSGVDAIGKAWDKLEGAAKKPVKFVVDTVINKGIVGNFNKIVDHFPGATRMPELKLPKGFRAGGKVWGPGTETSDSIPAMLSRNEHVLTGRDVRNLGGHGAIYRMRELAARGRQFLPALAGGGTLIDAANWWVRKGARGSRHPAFGGAVRSGHSKGSLHYQDRAVDLNYGPGGRSATEQNFFNQHLPAFRNAFPKGIHVIWMRGRGDHDDHMHIDNRSGAKVGDFSGGEGGGLSLDFFTGPFTRLKEKLDSQFESFGKFGEVAKGMGRKAIDVPIEWIKSNISRVADFLGETWEGAKETVQTGAAQTQARVWAGANNIPWSGKRMSALRWIIERESSWNPRAQNPKSTASGLAQMINSTSRAYAGSAPLKNLTVWKQLDAMMKYVNDRHGGAVGAKQFWQRNNYYAKGGAVGVKRPSDRAGGLFGKMTIPPPESVRSMFTPKLFDKGGLITRGVQLIDHQRRQPDRVLTDRQWDAMYSVAQSVTTGGGNHFHVTTPTVERDEVSEWLDKLEFSMTHLAKSQAFSGVNG